jgi:hypothetical protein
MARKLNMARVQIAQTIGSTKVIRVDAWRRATSERLRSV